jgi:hypothetical protein
VNAEEGIGVSAALDSHNSLNGLHSTCPFLTSNLHVMAPVVLYPAHTWICSPCPRGPCYTLIGHCLLPPVPLNTGIKLDDR